MSINNSYVLPDIFIVIEEVFCWTALKNVFPLKPLQAYSRIIRYFSVTALTKSVPQDLSIPNAHSVFPKECIIGMVV